VYISFYYKSVDIKWATSRQTFIWRSGQGADNTHWSLVHCIQHFLLDRDSEVPLPRQCRKFPGQSGKSWFCFLEGSHCSWLIWDGFWCTCPSWNLTCLEPIIFWCKFRGAWELPQRLSNHRPLSAKLGFLELNQIPQNLRRPLFILLPSIPWTCNQSQSSCLAIPESGNSLLVISFCVLPWLDNQGGILGQHSATHGLFCSLQRSQLQDTVPQRHQALCGEGVNCCTLVETVHAGIWGGSWSVWQKQEPKGGDVTTMAREFSRTNGPLLPKSH
jgi:hypothetical protein